MIWTDESSRLAEPRVKLNFKAELMALAAGSDLGALAHGVVVLRLQQVSSSLAGHRPDGRRGVERVADNLVGEQLDVLLGELVGHALGHDDTFGQRARLPSQ